MKGSSLVIDPHLVNKTPDELLSEYGLYLDSIVLVAKSEFGTSYYPSNTAPVDQKYGTFFSSFSTLASDIGIKVYALLHSHVDYYLSQQSDFAVARSGGFTVEGFVCPAQQTYWHYLSEIAKEIAKYPINGILLKDVHYPSESYCFCDNCRRDFALQNNVERDFTLEGLKKNPPKYSKWLASRVNSIKSLISMVTQRVHSIKKIDIYSEVLLDLQLNLFEGCKIANGQDIEALKTVTNHLFFHLNPWSGIPLKGSEEYGQLLAGLQPLRTYLDEGLDLSLFVWSVDEEDQVETIDAIATEFGITNIFVQEKVSPHYMDQRSLHLDVKL